MYKIWFEISHSGGFEVLTVINLGMVSERGMNCENVTRWYTSYTLNNFITCFLAYLGIALWVLDNEYFITSNGSKRDRFVLLSINLFINFLLVGSITLGHILWIQFGNLLNPILQVGISAKNADYEQRNLRRKLFSWENLETYLIEVVINLISPYPWLYDTEYEQFKDGHKIQFYFNTFLLTLMIIFRTYHLLRAILQLSIFMTPRAERMTRIFTPESKFTFP